MNFNKRLKCNTCETNIDCRIGLSNRREQPIKFSCPECGEAISINIKPKAGFTFKGAKDTGFEGPFDGSQPFVDLHIDFPVKFGKYEMGNTPFMAAVSRIGSENFEIHNHRLNALNQLGYLVGDLERVIRLYSKNPNLFGRLCKSKFGEELRTEENKDLNLALYCVIAKVFFPFSMPNDNADSVDLYMKTISEINKNKSKEFNVFIKDIIETGFLKKHTA